MSDPTRTGARAALHAQIADAVGDQQAAAIMAEKQRKTRTAFYLAGLTAAGTALAYSLHVSPLLTLGIAIGGGLWAGTAWSGEYMTAALKDLGGSVAGVISAIVKARRGGDG